MIAGSHVVFIVGFERCMTSSLAKHLVDADYSSLLVTGIKEPKVFSSDPKLAAAILKRQLSQGSKRWLLDASVNYISNRGALIAIKDTVEDYRIIICLRNQFQRTISAYRLYLGAFIARTENVSLHDWPFSLEFGDASTRLAAANDPLALPKLRYRPKGQYIHTAIAAFSEGVDHGDLETLERYDRAAAEFATQSFPTRVVRELQFFRRTGSFPLISVLHNSYFARPIENLLKMFDARRILPVTLEDNDVRHCLDATLARFFQSSTRSIKPLPHVLPSDQFGIVVSAREKAFAKEALHLSFREDSRKTAALLNEHRGLDLSLFSPAALY